MIRTIVITGATGALGSLTAKTFAARGHSLALLARDSNQLDSLARELNLPGERLFTAAVDLRDGAAVHSAGEAVLARFGGVYGLIHLVGGWTGGKTIPETSVDDFTSMLDQHVWTTFHLFQSFMPLLAKSGGGRVITVSPSTVSNPIPKRGAYTAAKAAQETLMLTLAAELKDSNVTANIIQVKAIDVENKGAGATPEEIVAAMLYLFSEEASKITGAKIPLY
ncbi:MAG TPA: SDR family oxidoreductase [Anaerolineales bacterium]|jgi:NAD(P)-dependent dehydrogenase (short-subunit alcohol dehydrogenase family)|nr:SDR family oxidoreductase [Anaerolineales bacterium]HQX17024.1 SDR family oxidoreductase [Anaerolineales bacterium]